MANWSPIGEQWRTVRPLANNGELGELDGWSIQSSGNRSPAWRTSTTGGRKAGEHDWPVRRRRGQFCHLRWHLEAVIYRRLYGRRGPVLFSDVVWRRSGLSLSSFPVTGRSGGSPLGDLIGIQRIPTPQTLHSPPKALVTPFFGQGWGRPG